MTKKHFTALAKILASKKTVEGDPVNAMRVWIARDIANLCIKENPRFDRARFLEAAGV